MTREGIIRSFENFIDRNFYTSANAQLERSEAETVAHGWRDAALEEGFTQDEIDALGDLVELALIHMGRIQGLRAENDVRRD